MLGLGQALRRTNLQLATGRPGAYPADMRPLTTDLTREDARPYFLWDEDVSISELRQVLAGPDSARRDQLFGKMLREARDLDVWRFVTPQQVACMLPRLARRLGRRRGFWEFLIQGWREDGLLAG